mgnify:CR=1 FL=1
MAFELPTLPFPKDSTGTPYIASPDANGKYTVASGQWFKNASSIWVPVSAADPLPVKVQTELPAGAQIIGSVKLAGSYATIDSAPVTGAKTVTTTAAEIFAGASRLANRYFMAIYNTDSSTIVYIGGSGVTTSTGFPIKPGDCVEFQFNPNAATAIYAIAPASVGVRVVELA